MFCNNNKLFYNIGLDNIQPESQLGVKYMLLLLSKIKRYALKNENAINNKQCLLHIITTNIIAVLLYLIMVA